MASTRCTSVRRTVLAIAAFLCVPLFLSAGGRSDSGSTPPLAALRVPFVANEGQMDARVAFSAPTRAGTAFVTKDGKLVYSLPSKDSLPSKATRSLPKRATAGWTLVETPVKGHARPSGEARAATRVSVFHGSDPTCWKTNISTFDTVSLGEVWPKISVDVRAHGNSVEKVFTVAPGGDPSRIRMSLDGAKRLSVDRSGALVARTDLGDVTLTAPKAEQVLHGVRRPVQVAYVQRGKAYGFKLSGYDPALPVEIDPIFQSTYLGGSDFDQALAVAANPVSGDVYVTGYTNTSAFPGVSGGAQSTYGGGFSDVFVARLNSTLTALNQATYLGGGDYDFGEALAISPAGEVYVAGQTYSTDFPGTTGGVQPAHASDGSSSDAFVARLSADLTSLDQATYLGGSGLDFAIGLALNPILEKVYVTGGTYSSNFPGVSGGAQSAIAGSEDAFVARLTLDLTGLDQSTFFGGTGQDEAEAIAINSASGEVYIGGLAQSSDLPGTSGGAQSASGGFIDAFLARFSSDLTALHQATYLGGSQYDVIRTLAVNPLSGDVYTAGLTSSTDFPGTTGGAQASHASDSGGFDAFVSRLSADLTTLDRSTYLGGGGSDTAFSLAIDPSTSEVYVVGETGSGDFPGTAGGAQPTLASNPDGFVARLRPDLTVLDQATYLGGTGGDIPGGLIIHPVNGDIYVAGQTDSTDFPATAGGAQASHANDGGGTDAFVARLTPDLGVACPGTTGFAQPLGSPFGAPTQPFGLVVGDFNGDGKLDLATPGDSSDDVTILLGDGAGGFVAAAGSPFPVGTGPMGIAAGDFNGDGKLDLLVGSSSPGHGITVLLGDGAGGFSAAPSSPITAGGMPSSIVVGDFNGDGKLDFAASNSDDSSVSVFLGDGAGGFSAASGSPFTVGSRPISVTAGDFNGDGKLDLVTANSNANTVSVLLGNGDGTFQAHVDYGTGPIPASVAVGDFNGDGKLDLATPNFFVSTVSVLLGNGNGTFQANVDYSVGSGLDPRSIVAGDFNGDGKLDLATANLAGNVSVLLGDGAGGFFLISGSPFGAGTSPDAVAIGDFNRDGVPDIAVANAFSNDVAVLLTQCIVCSATTTSVTAASSEYSDPVNLSATVSSTSTVNSGTVTFIVNGDTIGPADVVNGTATLTVANQTLGTTNTHYPDLAAGPYTIEADYSGAAGFCASTNKGTLTVAKEAAVVTPLASNPTAVQVNSPGGTAGPINLCADITEALDDAGGYTDTGDVSNAVPVQVTLTPVLGSGSYTHSIASGSVSSGILHLCYAFPSVAVNVYDVNFTIGGSYYTGSGDSVLAVYDPSLGFVTGGGRVINPNTKNPANFAFNIKYQKNNVITQGSALYIEHKPDGTVAMAKSNSMKSLSIVRLSSTSWGAVIQTKNTVFNGVGNYSIQMTGIDNGTPGKSDQFALTLYNPNGKANATYTFGPQNILGGNIVVPHK